MPEQGASARLAVGPSEAPELAGGVREKKGTLRTFGAAVTRTLSEATQHSPEMATG